MLFIAAYLIAAVILTLCCWPVVEPTKRDLWIGVYWKRREVYRAGAFQHNTFVYVCLLPCLPIVFQWRCRHVLCLNGSLARKRKEIEPC